MTASPGGLEPAHGWPAPIDVHVDSPALGDAVQVIAIRPPTDGTRRRWVWLLHGHGADADELRLLLGVVSAAMQGGALPLSIVAAPLAPYSDGAGWWVDSAYTGGLDVPAGRLIESAILADVLPTLEARWGGPDDRSDRLVAGISMGGAGALRWALVHRELFGAAVLLSPSVYESGPHRMSSARSSGAFGVGTEVYDERRYRAVASYQRLLAARPVDGPTTRVVTVVGDAEAPMDAFGPIQAGSGAPTGTTARHDIDLESARLHAALKLRPDVDSVLRVVDGGHTWSLWSREIVPALRLADPWTSA